jgi:hypothetical protein
MHDNFRVGFGAIRIGYMGIVVDHEEEIHQVAADSAPIWMAEDFDNCDWYRGRSLTFVKKWISQRCYEVWEILRTSTAAYSIETH